MVLNLNKRDIPSYFVFYDIFIKKGFETMKYAISILPTIFLFAVLTFAFLTFFAIDFHFYKVAVFFIILSCVCSYLCFLTYEALKDEIK